MGWMQRLCEVYDNCIRTDQSGEKEKLVTMGFIQKKVKYEVILDSEGNFQDAYELDERSQLQEIPSTLQAESRTSSAVASFPLAEQLKYLVYEEKNMKYYTSYMEQLKEWCDQSDAPEVLKIVYKYMEKHTLLEDLEACTNLKLKYYKDAKERTESGEDEKQMITFTVNNCDIEKRLCCRKDVRKSWLNYLQTKILTGKTFCYIEGEWLSPVENFPKISGNAKIISAKDSDFPFQYKGRFEEDRSAATVSFDAVVRAHNALQWLIRRQGLQKHGVIWVTWKTDGTKVETPLEKLDESEEDELDFFEEPDTNRRYARAANTALQGNNQLGYKLGEEYDRKWADYTCILGLKKGTDGRESVIYYQEFKGNEFEKRIKKWYWDCCWNAWSFKTEEHRKMTPTAKQIAEAVFGTETVRLAEADQKAEKSHAKLVRNLYVRLMCCIADGERIPEDLVKKAFGKTCNPLSFTDTGDSKWSYKKWESSLNSTCAMICCYKKRCSYNSYNMAMDGTNVWEKYYEKRDSKSSYWKESIYEPTLQRTCTDRDYLYGRLLAVADAVERREIYIEHKDKEFANHYQTNAIRYFSKFRQDPFGTWQKIYEKLLPYFAKLGYKGKTYEILLEEIEGLFSEKKRYERTELSLEFLLGFSCERQKLFGKNIDKKSDILEVKIPENILFIASNTRSELYGYLLAISDYVEKRADGEHFGKTNALRLMRTFAVKPYETWMELHNKLIPYFMDLGLKGDYYQDLIKKVEMQFSREEREKKDSLNSGYLHGYYCMKRVLYSKNKEFRWNPGYEEKTEISRSALYGKLWGIAENVEKRKSKSINLVSSYSISAPEQAQKWNSWEDEWRASEELRLGAAFAQKPDSTWQYVKKKISRQLNTKNCTERVELEKLEAHLRQKGWNNNQPLESVYLYEYYKNVKEKEKKRWRH